MIKLLLSGAIVLLCLALWVLVYARPRTAIIFVAVSVILVTLSLLTYVILDACPYELHWHYEWRW